MKRAVLLHGTDGYPEYNWFPWLRSKLEERGYTVWVPLLPGNHTPNRFVYDDYLRSQGWDFTDCLLIGHSSGATTALNLLSADWFPKVGKTILVGTFLNEDKLDSAEWYEKGQFDNLFPPSFDADKVRSQSSEFVFIHGLDDPYCSYDDALHLCDALQGEMVSIDNGLHLSSNRSELPEILPFV